MTPSANELLGIFRDLEQSPVEAGSISAVQLAGAPSVRVGRTDKGHPCILFVTGKSSSQQHLVLKHLEAQQGVKFRVAAPGKPVEQLKGTVIVCRADSPALTRLFFGFVADALFELGSSPTGAQLNEWITAAARLFSRLEKAGTKELRGLWAELLFISSLPDPSTGVRRWHKDPDERFDFLAASFAVEVKSCADLERVHHFSLGQLQPPKDMQVWVASIPVRADSSGSSVLELLENIEARIDVSLRAELRAMVLSCGGRALEEEQHHKFDESGASKMLRLMDVANVPTITGEIPPQVIKVTLQVRCRDIETVSDGIAEAQRRFR